MSTKTEAKKRPAKKATSKPRPSVSWVILAREFVADSKSGSVSAINIVEDIFFPASALGSTEKMNIISVSHPLCLGFTVDWRWPEPYEAGAKADFHIDWHAPSGNSFLALGENKFLAKPNARNRTHVQITLGTLPIEGEGIYHFEIFLNNQSAAKYPVRVWVSPEDAPLAPKKAKVKKSKPAQKRAAKAK